MGRSGCARSSWHRLPPGDLTIRPGAGITSPLSPASSRNGILARFRAGRTPGRRRSPLPWPPIHTSGRRRPTPPPLWSRFATSFTTARSTCRASSAANRAIRQTPPTKMATALPGATTATTTTQPRAPGPLRFCGNHVDDNCNGVVDENCPGEQPGYPGQPDGGAPVTGTGSYADGGLH